MYTLSLMLTDEVNTSSIRKELEIIRKDYESYLKIKVGMKEMKDNKNNEFTPGKCFPPPISCLKNIKVANTSSI